MREDRWPFLCDVDLSSLKGLEASSERDATVSQVYIDLVFGGVSGNSR